MVGHHRLRPDYQVRHLGEHPHLRQHLRASSWHLHRASESGSVTASQALRATTHGVLHQVGHFWCQFDVKLRGS